MIQNLDTDVHVQQQLCAQCLSSAISTVTSSSRLTALDMLLGRQKRLSPSDLFFENLKASLYQHCAHEGIKDHTLITVFDNIPNQHISDAWLEDKLDHYLHQDEVIRPDFFGTVLLNGLPETQVREVQTK